MRLTQFHYVHEDLDKWRANFAGVQFLHEPTNLLNYLGQLMMFGLTQKGNLLVVDYKATAKKS